MKSLVVFACLLVVAYGITPAAIDHIKTKLHKLGGECKTEMGASDADISPLLAHKLPETKEAKCFVACVSKKMGFQDKSGKIDKEGGYAEIEKIKPLDADLYEELKQIGETCLAEVKDDPNECETAANLMACAHKQRDEMGVMKVNVSI